MDFVSYNKNYLNRKRIEKIDSKTMVFVIPRIVQQGVVRTELRFPHLGKITDIYASCGVAGTSTTEISVEKCSFTDYKTTPVWDNILSTNLYIDQSDKSSSTSTTPFTLSDSSVSENDHFRVNVLQAGSGAEDITITIEVELNTEL